MTSQLSNITVFSASADAARHKIYNDIISLIAETVKPDIILLYTRDQDDLNLMAASGDEFVATSHSTTVHKVGECLCGIAARTAAPVYSNDILGDPRCSRDECKNAHIRSYAAVPLLAEDRVIGVLGVGSIEPRDFSIHSKILKPLAAAISINLRDIKSEKHFRQLYERMTEGVALHNVIRDASGQPIDYMIVDVNPAYEKILGLSRDTVIGKRASVVYGMDPPPFLKEFSNVAISKLPIEFEQYYDPITRHFHITVVPWEEDGFATIFFDITERKMNEEDIKKALSFVESLLKSSPMGIRVFEGISGKCILANQASADIAGASINKLVGQDFRKLQSWQSCGLTEMAEQVLTDGEARFIEADMVTTFDKPVAVRYFLSRFDDNETHYLLVLGRDANEEKRLEEENRRIEAKMLHMQKLESLGVLAGGIAHDFNNILMAILGNTELAMLALPHDATVNQNLREIERAAKRAAELAHQMLAYSGKGHFVVEPLDINRVICEMTALLDVSVSKKVALHLELGQGLPSIKADSAQLCQVIMNLIINASEAMEGQNGDITISTGITECSRELFSRFFIDDQLPPGQYVYMTISDTGCGMDEETISKLFEPFFTTKFTGRGLGMSAVLGIIRSHKGAINVESRKGTGSTFTIYLPVTQNEPAASSTQQEDLHQKDPLQQQLRGSGTILLVDDEETIRYMGQAMLELFGFRVITAADGFGALALYKEHSHEIVCVLLDLTMPHMDGEQTFTELRSLNPEIKVIISSGYSELEISDRFDGKGLSGFVQKPYQIQEIESILKKVLEG